MNINSNRDINGEPPPILTSTSTPSTTATTSATINHRHPLHNRHQVLKKYTTALLKLRTLAEQTYNVRPFYFDNYVLFQYFQQRSNVGDKTNTPADATPLAFLKLELLKHILDRRRQVLCYLMLAFVCLFVYRYEAAATLSVTERSMHFVYPSMRIWRRMTLPLIQRFPRLTELYDEPCLMENPFFQVEDLSCEPCAHVQGVLDLTLVDTHVTDDSGRPAAGVTPTAYVPFVFKMNQAPIQLEDFYHIYANNHKIFQRDAYRVQSTSNDVTNLEELFNRFNHSHNGEHAMSTETHTTSSTSSTATPGTQAHNMWRCNRMLPARLLRQLFPRPGAPHLPSTGIALERYMAIDTPQAPAYTLPETECANVFVQQARSSRYIILRPTSECRHRCRTLSMRLPESSVLSYNWLYWKPISAPDPLSDKLSISLIGSYC